MECPVRSTLDCGGSTPPWNYAKDKSQSGVEPPQSKVLRTESWTAHLCW
jgi:hypothetical protein